MSTIETKSTVLLKHHLKALRLSTMHAECQKIAERAAADNADHLAFLLQLCELELIERERKASQRRLKLARFPAHKLLDEFDFAARPSVNKPLLLQLLQGEFLTKESSTPSATVLGCPAPPFLNAVNNRDHGVRCRNHGGSDKRSHGDKRHRRDRGNGP